MCSVQSWDVEDYTVDYKNELSYSAGTWVTGTYFEELAGHEIWLDPTQEAEFNFIIQTPNTARWTAVLTDDAHFSIVEGTEGGDCVQDEDGTPLKQTVKVKVKDPDAEATYRTTLQIIAIIATGGDEGGKSYELDMVNGGQRNPSGEPARYTLVQTK